MSTASPRIASPRVYTHASRADWGRALVSEERPDRKTYFFENAGARTFLNGSPLIVEVTLGAEERGALARLIADRHAPPPAVKKASKPRVKKAASAASKVLSFERQLTLFATTSPRGFVDPAVALAEATTPATRAKNERSAVRFASEVLSARAIETALREGRASEVVANALRVLQSASALSLPKGDVGAFERLTPASHEDVATTLAALLHGTGDYAIRFDAFVKATGTTAWTIATVFPALVHPSEHFLVKSTMNQRQALAIGAAEPPLGTPTGEAYAKHLAVARTTKERLIAASMTPADLLDVYTFGWRTLTRAASASLTRTKS